MLFLFNKISVNKVHFPISDGASTISLLFALKVINLEFAPKSKSSNVLNRLLSNTKVTKLFIFFNALTSFIWFLPNRKISKFCNLLNSSGNDSNLLPSHSNTLKFFNLPISFGKHVKPFSLIIKVNKPFNFLISFGNCVNDFPHSIFNVFTLEQ